MTARDDRAGLPQVIDRLACSLVQCSARRAPASLSERLEEEWLADLAAQSGAISRLRFALGCCWATRVIAHEFPASSVAAIRSPAGQGAVAAFAPHSPKFFSGRMVILFVIVGLHAILIYAFANGFASKAIKELPRSIGVVITPKPTPPPPKPDPMPVTRRAEWGERKPQLDNLPIPSIITAPDVVGDSPVPSEPLEAEEASPRAVRHVGGPGRGFPDTDEYYPSSSRRVGENGSATVRVCVAENGRLTSNPTIMQSSGSPRLDEGALRLAKAASGHYRATTEDGRAVKDCYPFRIRFELKD